jgi:hypothetical protein
VDGLSLLERARLAGLDVRADGDALVVTGPKRHADLAQALLAAKAEVLAELEREARIDTAVPIYAEDFGIRTIEDLLALWGPDRPPPVCRACRSPRWWRIVGLPSISRPWVCADCHPPLVPTNQIEWRDGGRP